VTNTALPKAIDRRRVATIAGALVAAVLSAGWVAWSFARSADLRARAGEAVKRGDWGRAGAMLERLAWYRPHDLEALSLRVRVALAQGDPLAAAVLLARVPDSAPGAAEARLTRGRLLMQAFRPGEAEAALRDCLRIDPQADGARMTLLAILAVQGRGRDYEAEAWALLDRGGEPIRALRLLAQAAPAIPPDTFTRTADLGDVLRRCLAAEPDHPQTRVALARFERGRGRIDEALRILDPCLRESHPTPEARLEWAACLLDEGDFGPLGSLFERPDESIRSLGAFWLLKGEWDRLGGRQSDTLADYREAIQLDPRSPAASYRLGMALRDGGPEADRCLEVARKARELVEVVATIPEGSRDTDRLCRAGRLCAEIGRDREARDWLALALRADPGHAPSRAMMARIGPQPRR